MSEIFSNRRRGPLSLRALAQPRLIALVASLALPVTAGAQVRPVQSPDTSDGNRTVHTVQRGETLWALSRSSMGNPFRWPELWRLNAGVVKNPHWIYPGNQLVLPGRSAAPRGMEMPADTMPEQSVFLHRAEAPPTRSSPAAVLPTAPTRAVRDRMMEFFAAPYLVDRRRLEGTGRVIQSADVPGIAAAKARDRIQFIEEVALTLPPGTSAAPGSSFLSFRRGPRLSKESVVLLPTGIFRITSVSGSAAKARLMRQFDVVMVGQELLPLDTLTLPTAAPRALDVVAATPTTMVLWVASEPVLPTLYSYVVLGASSRDGVRPGDQFSFVRSHHVGSRPTGLPDDEIATARVVRVTPFGSTALIIRQTQPSINAGTAARLVARVP